MLNNVFLLDSLTLITFNLVVYIILLLNIFGLFFLFDIKFMRTLNELKNCGNLMFVSISLIISLLSLAGVPPLLGFNGKFLLFIYLIKTSNWFLLIMFSFINFFVIYFYIQNVRFMITKGGFYYFYFKNHHVYFNLGLIIIVIVTNLLNLFGVLFIDDFIIYFAYISSFFFLI